MKNEKKIIFFNSYLPRTGHNFGSQVIEIFSGHEVFSHPRSETRISRVLDAYFKVKRTHVLDPVAAKVIDSLFIEDLRKNILKHSNSDFILIKDTTLIGVNYLPDLFPEDIHLILIRDPKNVFASLIKGMNLQKKNWKNLLKKIGNKTGIYPWFYSRKLSRQVINEIPDLKEHYVIRYEDLVFKKEQTLLELQDLLQTHKSIEQIKSEIDEIHVINSSFYEEVKGKRIWDSRPKTENYDPVNRKANSWLIRKGIEIGSRQLRKKLNYI